MIVRWKHLPSASFELFGDALFAIWRKPCPARLPWWYLADNGASSQLIWIYLLVSVSGLFWRDFSDVRLSQRIQGRSCSRLSRLGSFNRFGGLTGVSRHSQRVLRQNNCNVLQLVWARESLPRRGPRWYSSRNEYTWTLMCHVSRIQIKASRCFNAPFDVACASQTILTFQDERL